MKPIIKESYIAVVIFVAALMVRLLFALPDNSGPVQDARVYDMLGLSLSQGKGYVDRGGAAHSVYPPAYPFFLSIIYRFFGHSYTAVKVIQSILGGISCLFIYLIGKRTGGMGVGLVSGIISILYFPFIKSAGLLLTELFFTFILLLITLYLLRISEKRRIGDCVLLGLFLGIAVLTKSITLFLPFFIIPALIYAYKKQFLKRCAIILIFLSLPMTPWIARNYNVYHSFIPTSVEGGLGLYASYFPSRGIFGLMPAPDDPVIIEAGKISSPVLRNRFFIKKTFEFIVNNPTKMLKLTVKKIVYFWAPLDWEIVGNRWLNLVYMAIFPFFIAGFLLSTKEFGRNLPVLMPIIYFQIMTLVFYGSPRFRLPIEPYLFILGAVGILSFAKYINKSFDVNVTRSYGLFERFLAAKRARVANKFISRKHRNGKILDIGCGSYPIFLLTSKFMKKFGLDKTRPTRPGVSKRCNFINYDIESVSEFPFSANSVDVITMLAIMEHIDSLKLTHIMAEVYRILKPGGICIITIPSPWAEGILDVMANLKLVSKIEMEDHKSKLSNSRISGILKGVNFSSVNFGYFEFFMNRWFLAKK